MITGTVGKLFGREFANSMEFQNCLTLVLMVVFKMHLNVPKSKYFLKLKHLA